MATEIGSGGNGGTNGGTLPPASDVDSASFVETRDGQQVVKTLDDQVQKAIAALKDPNLLANIVGSEAGAFISLLWKFLLDIEKLGATGAVDVLKPLVDVALAVLKPVQGVFGELSKEYVKELADKVVMPNQKIPAGPDSADVLGAKYAFDAIVAPLSHITAGADPNTPGAGATNIQAALGSIVSVHLMTWVINVVSNLTGVGTLKFMNSFNEVILAALNARGLSRVAMKPYLEQMMVIPATRELNTRFKQTPITESQAVKEWLRGKMTKNELKELLTGKGYKEDLTEQFLAEQQKYLSDADVGTLIDLGWWTEEQAITYLQQQGWNADIAPVLVRFERQRRVRTIQGEIAASAAKLLVQGLITEDVFRSVLHDLNFADAEIEALSINAQLQRASKTRLSLLQVRQLYDAKLVDLNYVQAYLEGLGHSVEDTNLLILLEFTHEKERDARRAELAAAERVQGERDKEAAAVATKKAETDLAAALEGLAAKRAALASSLGG